MLSNKQELMKEEILAEMARGATLEEIKDRAGEWIDNHLPIYNYEILHRSNVFRTTSLLFRPIE
jgi:predicted RNase H-like HicB family nuclease